jgi:oligoendopeptidase F
MSLLPFGKLPPHSPRRFVPVEIDLGKWEAIAPLFDQLEGRAQACATASAFEAWLLDWGELSAAIEEEGSRRYIAMTCHTDDAGAEQAYLHFVEHIEPQLKPRQFRLEKIYLEHPCRAQLPMPRYEVFDRNVRVAVELFREENVPLETEEVKLGQQYQKLVGSLTVQFRGEERTLVQMGRYLEEPDRALRQEAWELVAQRRLREADTFEGTFEGQLKIREQIGRNAGFANYRDYMFRRMGRFDYTPADCEQFHQAVETQVVPLLRELQARRREQLGVASLRPWDTAVDPLNRPALRPFDQVEQMVER